MEEYTIKTDEENPLIKQGKYYELVHAKHKNAYGTFGSNNIRDNIMSTYKEAIIQKSDKNKNNNILLVGKVQSGKTSNLELFTALAFDNGFNLVIIYGGYDNTLLKQTKERFENTFDIPSQTDYTDGKPIIFSSDDSNKIDTIDDEIIEDLLDSNKPIFLISMKRPVAMRKVNELLERIDRKRLNAFIIDDEGDQASLNTKKNKAEDASATYAEIVRMKDLLVDPLYLSVTATPQALIFQDNYSRLRPDSIRIIEPGKGYCGAEAYHLYDSDAIEIIEDDEQQDIESRSLADSLKNAINHYIIATAIMLLRNINCSDMIIHTHRNVSDHDVIYNIVNFYIETLKMLTSFPGDDEVFKNELKNSYSCYFSSDVQKEYDFERIWETIKTKITKRIYVILKNSTGQVTQANENLRKYRIYIGGDLLQRGVTFPKLVTTYFTRWPKGSGNMDTNLQRARWFGYRESYIDLCKIFTSSNISREFTNLAEIEIDLWEQFNAIQNGELEINDILIKADNTKQRPTRPSAAKYSAVVFKNKWIKQRTGVFDRNQIIYNNGLVDSIFSSKPLLTTYAGRTDGKESAKYVIINRSELTGLISKMEAIFDLEPFERKPLIDLIESSGDIPIIKMPEPDGGRVRKFYINNKIYALQQGASDKDTSKATYLGDSYVVVDRDKINIQVHKIIPKKKDSEGQFRIRNDLTQYMFAIYVPKEKRYYTKG